MDYKNKIKVIGFDLDQTLYPKSPLIDEAIQSYIYKKIAEHKNCEFKEAEKMFKDLYQDGKGLSGSKTLKALEIPNAKDVVQEALENADIAQFMTPNEEVITMLHSLGENYHIDIITGSNNKNCFAKLEKLGIPTEIFNHIITKDDADKSSGEAYTMWMSKYDENEPGDFLYIGDRVSSDYDVPREMNINSIMVNVKEKHDEVDCPQLTSLVEISELLL